MYLCPEASTLPPAHYFYVVTVISDRRMIKCTGLLLTATEHFFLLLLL